MKLITISSIALAALLSQANATPIAGCLLNYTITANDSCVSVAAQFQLNETDFYAMNPGLHHSVAHNCDNLDTGKPYCVCLTAPCPVSLSSNASVATAVASSAIESLVSSALASSAAVETSSAASASKSGSNAASAATGASQTTTTTSSAPTTKIFGAVAVGLLMAATSALI